MRNIVIFFLYWVLIFSSCKKKDCVVNVTDKKAFHKNYENNYHCAFVDRPFEFVFYDYDDFLDNSNQTNGCSWDNPVVVPLDFNGIVICYGVDTRYYTNAQQIYIILDQCEKTVNYKITIIEEDTLSIGGFYESVITVIDSIPSDYTVEISHEIIPYQE